MRKIHPGMTKDDHMCFFQIMLSDHLIILFSSRGCDSDISTTLLRTPETIKSSKANICQASDYWPIPSPRHSNNNIIAFVFLKIMWFPPPTTILYSNIATYLQILYLYIIYEELIMILIIDIWLVLHSINIFWHH